MPPKRKAAARVLREATDTEDEPKSKRARPAPKMGAKKKTRAYKMPPPLPAGQMLTDVTRKLSWSLGESVGKGGFGEIYRASPVGSSKRVQHVIKIEPHENGPLYTEIAFYCRVAKEEMIASWVSSQKLAYLPIPTFIAHGRHCHAGQDYRFLVMDCFGEDLEKKFNQCGRRFGSKTVCHLALRILEALEYLHMSEFAHGDIKGSNLLTGLHPSQQHQVYLVDYGLACRYRPDGRHRDYKEDPRRAHDGTLEFTSIDAHKGVTPSARGDLEILAYCLLQWWSGCLPWDQQVTSDDKEAVAQMKIRFRSDVGGLMKACFKSSSHPNSLKQYLTYVYGLDYETPPDYKKTRQMFVRELSSLGLRDDGKDLDWAAPGSKTAVVSEECDHQAPSSPPPKKKRGARGKKTVESPEPDTASSRGKKAPPTQPVVETDHSDKAGSGVEEPQPPKKKAARGRKRKSPRSGEAVPAAGSIRSGTSASSAVGGGGVMPQVSYPAALGYGVGNGGSEEVVEPSSKRSRATASRKKTRSRATATAATTAASGDGGEELDSVERPKRQSQRKSTAREKKGSRDQKVTNKRT